MRTLRVAFLSSLVLELVASLSLALVAVPVGLRLLSRLARPARPRCWCCCSRRRRTCRCATWARGSTPRWRGSRRPTRRSPYWTGGRRLDGAPRRARDRAPVRQRRDHGWRGSPCAIPARRSPRWTTSRWSIAPGERVALVGRAARQEHPAAPAARLRRLRPGRVLVDGADLSELDLARWRGRLGVRAAAAAPVRRRRSPTTSASARPDASDRGGGARRPRPPHAARVRRRAPEGYDTCWANAARTCPRGSGSGSRSPARSTARRPGAAAGRADRTARRPQRGRGHDRHPRSGRGPHRRRSSPIGRR